MFRDRTSHSWHYLPEPVTWFISSTCYLRHRQLHGVSILSDKLAEIWTYAFFSVSFSATLLGVFIAIGSTTPPGDSQDKNLSFFASLLAALISTSFLMTIFVILYFVFVIRFGNALRQWDDKIAGRCYHFDYIASPNSSHPLVDELYLAFTALSSFTVLFVGLPFASPPHGKFWKWVTRQVRTALWSSAPYGVRPWGDSSIRAYIPKILFTFVFFAAMFLTFLQYPLHLYMIIQLRRANPHNAANGGSEDKWDFGQVAALVLILPVVKECIAGYITIED